MRGSPRCASRGHALEMRGRIDVIAFRAPGEIVGSINGLNDVAPEMKSFPPPRSFDRCRQNDEVELPCFDALDERLNRVGMARADPEQHEGIHDYGYLPECYGNVRVLRQ